MILASRRSVGLGVNQEVQGVLAGKYTNPGIAAPDMRQEAKMLFNQADELLQQGMQSEDNLALIEAVDSYRRGLALLARQESPPQWDLVRTNLAVALGFTAVIYAIFTQLLHVPMPQGILEFL